MVGITNINGVSSASVNNNSIKQNQINVSEDPQIKALTKQKENLEKQIKGLKEGLNNSNKDNNIKIEGGSNQDDIIKNLQNQVSEIEKQITTLKSEKVNNQANNQNTAIDSAATESNRSSSSSSKIISNATSLNNIQMQYSVKQKLQDSSKVLESEIKLDKGRGLDTTKQEETLSNMKDNINQISDKVGKALKEITNKEDNNDETSSNNEEDNNKIVSDGTNYDKTVTEKSKNGDNDENTLSNYSDNYLIGNFVDKKS